MKRHITQLIIIMAISMMSVSSFAVAPKELSVNKVAFGVKTLLSLNLLYFDENIENIDGYMGKYLNYYQSLQPQISRCLDKKTVQRACRVRFANVPSSKAWFQDIDALIAEQGSLDLAASMDSDVVQKVRSGAYSDKQKALKLNEHLDEEMGDATKTSYAALKILDKKPIEGTKDYMVKVAIIIGIMGEAVTLSPDQYYKVSYKKGSREYYELEQIDFTNNVEVPSVGLVSYDASFYGLVVNDKGSDVIYGGYSVRIVPAHIRKFIVNYSQKPEFKQVVDILSAIPGVNYDNVVDAYLAADHWRYDGDDLANVKYIGPYFKREFSRAKREGKLFWAGTILFKL